MLLFSLIFSFLLLCQCSRHAFPNTKCFSQSFDKAVQSGSFKTPGFPQRYQPNWECAFEIQPSENQAVALTIEYFSTEEYHDYVTIYQLVRVDGQPKAIKHAVLSGTEIAQTNFYSQEGGGFRIVFKSDFSESDFAGFLMSFNRFDVKLSPRNCPEIVLTATEKTQVASNPANVSHELNCVLQINSTESVEINVARLNTFGLLEVYETENLREELRRQTKVLARINGIDQTQFPVTVISRSKSMTIIMKKVREYEIDYQKIMSPCHYESKTYNITTSPVEFVSPGWPVEYCDATNYSSNFVANFKDLKKNEITAIKFNLHEVELEPSHDSLIFYEDDIMLKKYSPNLIFDDAAIKVFTIQHNNALVRFQSDASVTYKGFNTTVEAIKIPKECQCPSLANNRISFKIRPRCQYLDCFWGLVPPQDEESRYRVVFDTKFKLEDENEFVEFYTDFLSHDSAHIMKHFKLLPEMSIDEHPSDKRIVLPALDEPVKIWYHREAVAVEGVDHLLDIKIEWKKRCVCPAAHLKATDDWQELTSPDYPDPYCDSMNCTHVITAPEGKLVEVNVTLLDLEYSSDTLSLFDGDSMNSSKIDQLTGLEYFNTPFRSSSASMTLYFKSDRSLASNGYVLQYRFIQPVPDESSSGGFTAFHAFVGVLVVGIIGSLLVVVKRYRVHETFFETVGIDQRLLSMNSLIQSLSDITGQNENRDPFANNNA
ncbi:unnamed protein product [Bursaphelenchus xylophilus]|uniref:(pine wood nematode) hypothetical protein n=1 Tax=Bursaphelenchus xylophilus TaxID=6326 RepID=A0A1I7RKE0_BURXY|nr:unnamed protein product [Bursaphelenchus xylophilus]CAG9131367.1 unnamed protein product [Bursaphelenchus xylophilus]